MTFPQIDPIAIQIGPLAIHWYGISYLAAFVLGWLYFGRIAKTDPKVITDEQVDNSLFWIALGVVIGGRLGYVLFYDLNQFIHNPLHIFALWKGGMSFHGGLIGVAMAVYFFTKKEKIHLFVYTDILSCVAPIGLFFGRIANFINGELFGRISDVPWAIVFPHGGDLPRHPSQLYEAFLEGLILFIFLNFLRIFGKARRFPGLLTGFFLIGYAVFRSVVELFREPDAHIGFLFANFTMGQLLSYPMILLGIYCLYRSIKNMNDKRV